MFAAKPRPTTALRGHRQARLANGHWFGYQIGCIRQNDRLIDVSAPTRATPGLDLVEHSISVLRQALATSGPLHDPLNPDNACLGQQLVDTDFASAKAGCTLPLME